MVDETNSSICEMLQENGAAVFSASSFHFIDVVSASNTNFNKVSLFEHIDISGAGLSFHLTKTTD